MLCSRNAQREKNKQEPDQRKEKPEKPASLSNRAYNEVVTGESMCLESKRPRGANGIEDCELTRNLL